MCSVQNSPSLPNLENDFIWRKIYHCSMEGKNNEYVCTKSRCHLKISKCFRKGWREIIVLPFPGFRNWGMGWESLKSATFLTNFSYLKSRSKYLNKWPDFNRLLVKSPGWNLEQVRLRRSANVAWVWRGSLFPLTWHCNKEPCSDLG